MTDIGRAIALGSRRYGERASTAYAGYIHRDPMALLRLRLGRANPYPIYGAANRDPDVYDSPGMFDINRVTTADHLAFSSGIHYCIGQPLARLEATTALRMLAERMPGLSRAGTVRRRNTTTIRGPAQLPVSTGARRRTPTPAPRPVPVAGGAARSLPESGWPAGRPPGRPGRSR